MKNMEKKIDHISMWHQCKNEALIMFYANFKKKTNKIFTQSRIMHIFQWNSDKNKRSLRKSNT